MNKLILLLIVIIVIVSYYKFSNITHNAETAMSNSLNPVDISNVTVSELNDTILATGNIIPKNIISLTAESDGNIVNIFFEDGEYVEQGALLVQLDDLKESALLESAESQLLLSELEYERVKDLAMRNTISKQELDSLYYTFLISKSDYKAALIDQDKRKITAPFSGYLNAKELNVGDYMEAGKSIVELIDTDNLMVSYLIPSHYRNKVMIGQNISISIASDGVVESSFGNVTFISPIADLATHTLNVQASIGNNTIFSPGQFVRIEQILSNESEVILVPEHSIVILDGDYHIYRFVDNKANLVQVTLGRRKDGFVQILSGLNIDDIVIIAGQHRLADGDSVIANS